MPHGGASGPGIIGPMNVDDSATGIRGLPEDDDRAPHGEVGDDDVGPPALDDRLEVERLIGDGVDQPRAELAQHSEALGLALVTGLERSM